MNLNNMMKLYFLKSASVEYSIDEDDSEFDPEFDEAYRFIFNTLSTHGAHPNTDFEDEIRADVSDKEIKEWGLETYYSGRDDEDNMAIFDPMADDLKLFL